MAMLNNQMVINILLIFARHKMLGKVCQPSSAFASGRVPVPGKNEGSESGA